MIRAGAAMAVLAAVGLFGYFYLQDNSAGSRADKARTAVERIGGVAKDQGTAGLVRARLASQFGLEAARFLHTHFDEGTVLIYGLVPDGVSEDTLVAECEKLPGVKRVEVLVHARPARLQPSAANAPSDPG